jgi:uroporphyrinogen decarboxylase
MPVESMTPRERWQAVLRRQKPDRLPMDYTATPEADRKLLAHVGCADAWEMCARLHIDRRVWVAPRYVGPPPPEGCNEFGCRFADIAHEGGAYSECVGHPLADCASIGDIERTYRWPTADDYDYLVVRAQVRGHEPYPVQGGGSEPFLLYAELRGLQQAYRDLIVHPDMVAYCLDRLFDLAYERTRRIYEQLPGRVDLSYIAEDLGSQHDLLFSPQTIRTVLLPRMRRMVELAHQAGVAAFCHSDGAIRKIIPDLIAIGMDVLNPIQWRCTGMAREELKRDFGQQIVFHGAMDNQQTLAFGSPDDVRAEVLENIRVLGADGGHILAPCHNIQVVSPPENIVAMYATGYENGWCQ